MKHDPVGDAYVNFQQKFYPGKTGVGLYFWNFIGLKKGPMTSNPKDKGWNGWVINDPVIQRRIELMAGPYSAIAIKILLNKGHRFDLEVGCSDSDNDLA